MIGMASAAPVSARTSLQIDTSLQPRGLGDVRLRASKLVALPQPAANRSYVANMERLKDVTGMALELVLRQMTQSFSHVAS